MVRPTAHGRRSLDAALGCLGSADCRGCVAPGVARAFGAVSAVPRPDHIVIVIDENRAQSEVVGSPSAPYINSLAASGANFSRSFAVTHPSMPNYLALFAGSTPGVTQEGCPQTWSTPNLGTSLIAAGLGFAGYSEGLPSVGYTGCTSGQYFREHNPWVDFPAVPAADNLPLTAFPADYSTLPPVSFVVPNELNDMHTGTVAQGDTWLQNTMGGYITWAKTHNSVFALTFDEDDYTASNQIATIITGQGVVPGTHSETINHYNLLRTVEDAYGLSPVGQSATATPILDIWAPPTNDQPPTAAFTASCTQLTCAFNASGSTDPDGSITAYSWAFGDGATGTGITPSHAYATGGTRTVILTVTDNQGAASLVSHPVAPVGPTPTTFVSDSFNRTVTGGLGSADVGGAWHTVGTASSFSVTPGAASLLLAKPASQLEAYIGPVQTNADLLETLSANKAPTGGPLYLSILGRRVGSGTYYTAKVVVNVNASVTVRISRLVSGTETILAGPVTVSGVTFSAGTKLDVRTQIIGTNPTTLRAKLWPSTATEPASWQISTTDATASLQAGGAIGLIGYLSGAATNAPLTLTLSAVIATTGG